MANLRALRLSVRSSTRIDIEFTADLDTSIGTENVSISAAGATVKGLTVKSVSVSGPTMSLTVTPMTSRALYEAVLASTDSQVFRGERGETLIEDGATNHLFFVGPGEDNPALETILASLPGLYDTEESFLKDAIEPGALQILKASRAAREVRAANFISVTVEDEEITRGGGPTDRFANEGVFQLIRAGATAAGSTSQGELSFDSFPSDPISLQQVEVDEEEVSNTVDAANGFEGLIVTLSSGPVIKLLSLALERGAETFEYDIDQFRYGLLESKFDTDNAYPALDLEENQVRLSTSAVGPSFPLPQGSDIMRVSYLYKKGGRIVAADEVAVTSVVEVPREAVPAVSSTFFLDNAPIVNEDGTTPVRGGVAWLDPAQNFDPDARHPAFLTEVPFNESSLPSSPGEFAVEYSTGRVFVAGVDGSGTDGTTVVPPVASYFFQRTFQDGLDYNFFSDLNELAAVEGRDLAGSEATISFGFEDTFADGTDFEFASHVEILGERIENRLIGTSGLRTLNGPVNDVFRIFNETTGEIYTATRISGNKVYFSSNTPPDLRDVEREAADFDSQIQDQIVVTDTLSVAGKPFSVFKVELSEIRIVSATGDTLGASFNSSLTFSDTDTFRRELWFDPDDTEAENLLRLEQVGDYMVDYALGIAYAAVAAGDGTDIGDATYRHAKVRTRNSHIVSVNDLYRSASPTAANTRTFTLGEVGDELVEISDLEEAAIRTRGSSPLTVMSSGGTDSIYVTPDPFRVRHIFHVTDLALSPDPVDFAPGATVSDGYIVLSSSGVPVEDAGADETGLVVQGAGGARRYIDTFRLDNIASGGTLLAQLVDDASDPTFLRRNYSVVDLATGTDYFSFGSDGYVDKTNNRIVLPSAVPVSVAGRKVSASYRAQLLGGAAVAVNFTPGDIFVDYTYLRDEILVSYEYGDNVLDWSISDTLSEGETYFVSYRYGALRDALRDNFGALTSVEELSTIPSSLSRESYRSAVRGALQSFLTGPTIPAIKNIVAAFTEVDPDITESVFQEWILGRDHLHLLPMKLLGSGTEVEAPGFAPGKFGDGLLVSIPGQTATIPATSNMRFAEGTWEAFVTPEWAGIENDAELTLDLLLDGYRMADRVFIGASNQHPEEIPFTASKDDPMFLGRPTALHSSTGFFLWYDATARKWRLRCRAPIADETLFEGTLGTTGQFNDVREATSADGYAELDGYDINEINDDLTSTDSSVRFEFVVDGYDVLNIPFDVLEAIDSYESIGGVVYGFDGIDFRSDNIRYLFDAGVEDNLCRLSMYKDGRGFLRLRAYDENGRVKALSADISDWEAGETHHVAASWNIGTIIQQDELHMFVDSREVENTYRFRGFLPVPSGGVKYLDRAAEELVSSVSAPTVGGFDLVTTAGSGTVTSLSGEFVTRGVAAGDPFVILDSTADGLATRTAPFVYVRTVLDNSTLVLESKADASDPPGSGTLFSAAASLTGVRYSVNQLELPTVSDPVVEKVRVFSIWSDGTEVELFSPDTLQPDYSFDKDGYQDFVVVSNGVPVGASVELRSYGLTQQRCRQFVYVWPNRKTNMLRTIMPQPTSVSKIRITAVTVRRTIVEPGTFGVIATDIGGHLFQVLSSNLDFCQPTNNVKGRRLTATITGDNFDFLGANEISFVGTTASGATAETLSFTATGSLTTTEHFTSLTDVIASFTPLDITQPAGSVEIREASPITQSENDGDAAEVRLSVVVQAGTNGVVSSGKFTDGYARFGAESIGDVISIASVPYTIVDVDLDPSGAVKDSDTVTLSPAPADATGLSWQQLKTSYSDSGFANGLITLEIEGSGGLPFLLSSCWYEVDFPAYLTIPWSSRTPRTLYIGSDRHGENPAAAVIDEMRILSEASSDTGNGESAPSSGRSITTDAQTVREYEATNQTLVLFHFNGCAQNKAPFLSSFSQGVFQSENSVNELFGQSAVFNRVGGQLTRANQAVFQNDEGMVEFWVSPILDTRNDPTRRYYVDLTPELSASATALSSFVVPLPSRARSVSSVTVEGDSTNYFTGGSLSSDGLTVTLGQPLPGTQRAVTVAFVPITSRGDRFSIFKDENGFLQLFVSAAGTEYQISVPVFWKKNSWHRVAAGWDLNNADNQDRLLLMVDGAESGTVRYGTGLVYGTGAIYGMPTVFGSAQVGTVASRNILADINLTDIFSQVHIGGDFTGQFPALARMDNVRFSNSLRGPTLLGGTGPGRLIAQDLLFTSNVNTAQPVVEDALTTLLLDFDTNEAEVTDLATVHDGVTGIFDFFVSVIDSFSLIPNTEVEDLIVTLIERLKPAHTRAFVDFGDDDC